jgi:hypothetical protein
MACWSHQLWNAKAFCCRQTNSLPGIACSFILNASTPLNSTYTSERTDFSSAGGPADASGLRQFVRKPTTDGLERILSTN